MARSLLNTSFLPSGFYMASHPSPPTSSLLATYFLECETDPGHKSFFVRVYQQEFPGPRTPCSKSPNHLPALIHTNPQPPDSTRPWKLPWRSEVEQHYQLLYLQDGEGSKEENFWYCSVIEQLGSGYPKLDLWTPFPTERLLHWWLCSVVILEQDTNRALNVHIELLGHFQSTVFHIHFTHSFIIFILFIYFLILYSWPGTVPGTGVINTSVFN